MRLPKPKFVWIVFVLIILLFLVLLKDRADAPSVDNKDQPTTNQNTSLATFDKQKFSISDPASPWVVVNKNRPLNPLAYEPGDLENISGQRLRAQAAEALSRMIEDAKTAGLIIKPLSGYRSYSRQVVVYNNEVATYGQAKADTQSAKPGHSEHQTGWAVDVGGGGCNIDDCFGNTKEGKWVAANAYRFGFIVRYVTGKENITGYRAEPWHIRYVGVELSEEMFKQSVQTLEEFFEI